jgi:periplasmic divalent cation tolerance protein
MPMVQLLTAVASREDALSLAHGAVDERVAACVQIIGPMTSVYRWKGTVEETTEFLCLMKTPLEGLERLISFVRDRHPYDTPEITAVESLFTDARYLAWARSETVE